VAIAFDSTGFATGNGVTTLTIDITSAAVGAFCYCWIGIGTAPETVTMTGWTSLVDADEGTSSHYSGWYRQKQSGDTTFAPSWGTAEGSSAVWMSYTGVNTSTPHEGFASATHTVSSASFVTPTGTPTTTGRWAVSFYDGRSTSAAFTFTNATATQRNQTCNTANRWMSVSGADSNGTVAATAQSYTATSSASQSHGATALLFLIPASAAASAFVPAETAQYGGYF
jgi:hypothetical protein